MCLELVSSRFPLPGTIIANDVAPIYAPFLMILSSHLSGTTREKFCAALKLHAMNFVD